MFPHRVDKLENPVNPIVYCYIDVYDPEAILTMGMNETYSLVIKEGDNRVTI